MPTSATVAVGVGSNPDVSSFLPVSRSSSGVILVRVGQPSRIGPKCQPSGVPRLRAPAPFRKSSEFPEAGWSEG